MNLSIKEVILIILFIVIVNVLLVWTYMFVATPKSMRGSYFAYIKGRTNSQYELVAVIPGDIIEWITRKVTKPETLAGSTEQRLEEYYATGEVYPKYIGEVVNVVNWPLTMRIEYERLTPKSYAFKVIDDKTGIIYNKSRSHEE